MTKSTRPPLILTPDKIDRDGVYTAEQLPMARYHSDCCVGPSVSGSDLVMIEQDTLAEWWDQSYFNPQRERKSSPAMEFGKAAHYLLLGETEFAKHFVVKAYDEFRTDEAKAWRDAQTKQIISKQDLDNIGLMAKAIANHKHACKAFRDGTPEQSIIWKDKETGLWLKSRPDWFPAHSPYVPNYKTSQTANKRQWMHNTAFRMGYDQKEALRVEGFKQVLGLDIIPYFVLQSTKRPFLVSLPCFRAEDLEIGHILNRKALIRLARALDAGKFPGYDDDGVTMIARPPWKEKEFLDRHAAGEFEDVYEAKNALAERGPAKKGVYSK